VHFWLLFLLLATYCLFREPQQWGLLVVGSLGSILSIYSFAAGVATGLVLFVGFLFFKCRRAYLSTARRERIREVLQLFLVVILIGGALAIWIIGYDKPSYRPPWVLPYRWTFWSFFLNLISFGFAVKKVSVSYGVVCFLIVIIPLPWIAWRRRGSLTSAEWASFVLVGGIFADLAIISIGRASYGIGISKYPEYAEHAMPLIILSVVNWALLFGRVTRAKAAIIVTLWLFCFFSFLHNWNFSIYEDAYKAKLEGVACVRNYYQGTGAGRCPTVFPFPGPMNPYLDQAKRLNASFYRELMSDQR
jgi:hypothetical protein